MTATFAFGEKRTVKAIDRHRDGVVVVIEPIFCTHICSVQWLYQFAARQKAMLHDLWQIGDLREVQQKPNSTASHQALNFCRVVQSHSSSRIVTRKMMRQGCLTPYTAEKRSRIQFLVKLAQRTRNWRRVVFPLLLVVRRTFRTEPKSHPARTYDIALLTVHVSKEPNKNKTKNSGIPTK